MQHRDDDLQVTTTLRFERRRETRTGHNGSATVVYSDGAGRVGLGSVELVDASHRGLGVRSQQRIEPGMIVTLYPTTCGSGPSSVDAIATHCERTHDEWHIGLRIDNRMAA